MATTVQLLKIAAIKRKLRREYLYLRSEYDKFSCGAALAGYIRPDLEMRSAKLREAVASLKKWEESL